MKTIYYILFLFATSHCSAQDVNKCIVHQYSGTDSTKKHIALVQIFNQKGQIVSETYSNYKKSSAEGNSDGTYHYYYEDTLLTRRIFIATNLDTTKTLYHYNELKQLIKEEFFSCEKRLKKDVKKGFGQPGGCIVFEDDYEKNRTWLQTNEVTYAYDDSGRRIKKIDGQDYDRVWTYDGLNRIIQEKGYSSDKLAYVENYEYFKGCYKYSQIFYDGDGNPKEPEYYDFIFNPIFTTTCYLNYKGKIIKEEIATEKGTKISDETTYYDSNGRIVKTIHRYLDKHYINKHSKPQTIHIFEYK